MAKFEVTVSVEYVYEVEADSIDEAETMGWDYEDYAHHASVGSIEVAELEEDSEEEEEGE